MPGHVCSYPADRLVVDRRPGREQTSSVFVVPWKRGFCYGSLMEHATGTLEGEFPVRPLL